MKQGKITDKDTSLPDALNALYAQFKQNASGAVTPVSTALDTLVLTVTAADIRSVLLGVKFGMSLGTLTDFYRFTIESILSRCTTLWYGNCSAQDHKKPKKCIGRAATILMLIALSKVQTLVIVVKLLEDAIKGAS
eukprot:g43954.t1